MRAIGGMATDDEFKATLARWSAAAATTAVDLCSGCDGSGWAMFQGRAYACVCTEGQKRPATVRTIRDVADADTLRGLFPNGLPTETVGWSLRLEACGVGRAESRYTFDTFERRFKDDKTNMRHLQVARLWIDTEPSKRSDLVLFGSHGRGKTGLAVALAHALVARKEHSVQFTECETIATRIRGTYRHGDDGRYDTSDRADTEQDIVAELTQVGTLIVDEVTGVKLTEFVDDKLRTIVTTRQRQERATILTLNVDGGLVTDPTALETALARMLGPALYDRLAERAQFLALFGASTRGKGRH